MLGPWNAGALPEIMAEAVEEGKRGVLGDDGRPGSSRPATKKRSRSKQVAQPEQARSAAGARGGGMRTPSQGLT